MRRLCAGDSMTGPVTSDTSDPSAWADLGPMRRAPPILGRKRRLQIEPYFEVAAPPSRVSAFVTCERRGCDPRSLVIGSILRPGSPSFHGGGSKTCGSTRLSRWRCGTWKTRRRSARGRTRFRLRCPMLRRVYNWDKRQECTKGTIAMSTARAAAKPGRGCRRNRRVPAVGSPRRKAP